MTDPEYGDTPAWHFGGDQGGSRHGFVTDRLHASYLHTHWAGHPDAAERFVEACVDASAAGGG
jgi:cobyrinic acid a,c-diamide synthase